ncbi:MAG: protein-L-isoaspartate(D-aspartate) O-methyltransferase [Alphaproteobacteria bacterium]
MSLDARKIRLIMELRQSGIVDLRVLEAMERTPREHFVPEPFQDQSYQNRALPLGHGQTISQPLVVAEMTQALALGERMKVLEIGTGSGYQAAILARLCRRVYTVERHRPLLREAILRFEHLRLHNITTRVGDGTRGWHEQAPFDRILVTAAAETIPEAMIDQLAKGGLMVLPLVRSASDQHIVRVRRTETGYDTERLSPARFVPLVAGALPEDLEWALTRHRRQG